MEFVAVFPSLEGSLPTSLVPKQKNPLSGVGGLRKDQRVETDDEKVKGEKNSGGNLFTLRLEVEVKIMDQLLLHPDQQSRPTVQLAGRC